MIDNHKGALPQGRIKWCIYYIWNDCRGWRDKINGIV
jgi:hypothetical protein